MIDDGGLSISGQKSGAAEHLVSHVGRREGGGMPLPVNHVRAGDMGIGGAAFIFDDVVKVIPPFPEEDAIGIARSGFGRMGEMVGEPGCRRLYRHRRGVRLWGCERRWFRRLGS